MNGDCLQSQEDNLVQYTQEHSYQIVDIYRDEGNSARQPITKRTSVTGIKPRF